MQNQYVTLTCTRKRCVWSSFPRCATEVGSASAVPVDFKTNDKQNTEATANAFPQNTKAINKLLQHTLITSGCEKTFSRGDTKGWQGRGHCPNSPFNMAVCT